MLGWVQGAGGAERVGMKQSAGDPGIGDGTRVEALSGPAVRPGPRSPSSPWQAAPGLVLGFMDPRLLDFN